MQNDRRTVIFELRPSDLDREAHNRPVLDLIQGIGFGSNGWEPSRAWGRRRSPAGGSVRGGAARSSPGFTKSTIWGSFRLGKGSGRQ